MSCKVDSNLVKPWESRKIEDVTLQVMLVTASVSNDKIGLGVQVKDAVNTRDNI